MGYTLESGSLDRGGEMGKGVCEWDQIDMGGRFLLEITYQNCRLTGPSLEGR